MRERKWFYNEEIVNGNKELDYLNIDYIQMNIPTTTTFVIPKVFQYRPDLISMRFYGNYHMGWLIALHNDFLDPIYEFEFNTKIKIPDYQEFFRYYKVKSRRA